MNHPESVSLTRDVDAAMVPYGTPVTLNKGEQARITQSLGGTYTVIVNGNMFRVESRNADALGIAAPTADAGRPGDQPLTPEELEKTIWEEMRNVYDPEIPVNIVDLGLIYDCSVVPLEQGSGYRVDVKMTLTAPGCGMGPVLQQDVQNRILSQPEVQEANVELVWEPPWNQNMMAEAARLQLGLL